MTIKMFQKALAHYRNQKDLEEICVKKDKMYLFFDDGFYYPINNVENLDPIDFFNINTDRLFYKKDLNDILKRIDSKLFFCINKIHVVLNDNDIESLEEMLGRELLFDTVGQNCSDTNDIVINVKEIINWAKDISKTKEEFFKTVVFQFYMILLHELGHASLRENFLPSEYSPLYEYLEEYNEEEVVEDYAEYVFYYLDDNLDVFSPFNKDYIISKF